MFNLIVILSVLLSAAVSNAGAYCTKGRSKPCGNGCIAEYKTCRTPWTTAKYGVNPNKGGKPAVENPQYVESAPKQ